MIVVHSFLFNINVRTTYKYEKITFNRSMKRINVMVSDEAKEKLLDYQKYRRLNTQDETVNEILMILTVPRTETKLLQTDVLIPPK